jgi:hypothetical protein
VAALIDLTSLEVANSSLLSPLTPSGTRENPTFHKQLGLCSEIDESKTNLE